MLRAVAVLYGVLLLALLALAGCSGRAPSTATPPTTAKAGATWTAGDGKEMVFVPAGEFLRGSREGTGREDEQPQRRVYLDGFWIDKTEVTVGEYRKFCEATQRADPGPSKWRGQSLNSPAVGVSWEGAAADAAWAGEQLPTEAQWEKAARGTDGRTYPWGTQAWSQDRSLDTRGWGEKLAPGDVRKGHHSRDYAYSDVGLYPEGASPYGARDMGGKAFEWCADWYRPYHYRFAPARNPHGPGASRDHVLRGGPGLRVAARHRWLAGGTGFDIGFRCVRAVSTVTSLAGAPAAIPSVGKIVPQAQGRVWTSPIDGRKMVFVPAGEFVTRDREVGERKGGRFVFRVVAKERAYVDAYWIDQTTVTVADYRKYCRATDGEMPKEAFPDGPPDLPITNVTWEEAAAYARWAGKQLPTNLEWEKAARGTDGRRYPWTTSRMMTGPEWEKKYPWTRGWDKEPQPVGKYPQGASPYGALDMSGNVAEWCADWFDAVPRSAATGIVLDPKAPRQKVAHGWVSELTPYSANRSTTVDEICPRDPALGDPTLGFRCVVRVGRPGT